jgi:hypothetical protein
MTLSSLEPPEVGAEGADIASIANETISRIALKCRYMLT